MGKCFQCFLLNSIYYKGRVTTEEWGGVVNMPLCFPKYLQSCGSYQMETLKINQDFENIKVYRYQWIRKIFSVCSFKQYLLSRKT